jgi:hypothetical protein
VTVLPRTVRMVGVPGLYGQVDGPSLNPDFRRA